MFHVTAAAAKAAGPHVASAAVSGAKSLVGFAIATKASHFAKNHGGETLEHIDDAVGDAKAAAANAKSQRIAWENVSHQESKTA